MTPDKFRSILTAFRDPQAYPNGEIELWLDLADKVLLASRWADYHELGTALWVAHNLVLAKRDEKVADGGGIPGAPTGGIVSSKSVGSVSVSYDTQNGLEQGAGQWNLTSFGVRFYQLMRLVGMGGSQLGGPDITLGPTFGPGWPGVL